MKSRLTLAGICLLAAFGLAACGGGGTASTTPTTGTGMTPTTGTGMTPTTGTGMMPDGGTDPAAARSAGDLFAAAQNSRDAATAAATAAAKAVTDATNYSDMIDPAGAEGSSATATANAQKVLDAQQAAIDAVTNAEAALQSAMDAKTAAAALDDANENKLSLIAALDAAITAAEVQVQAAKDSRDDAALKTAVDVVTGGDAAEPQMVPADHGKAVANAIATAIGPDATIGTAPVPAADDLTDNHVVKRAKAVQAGKTWEELAVSLGHEVYWRRVIESDAIVSVRAIRVDGADVPTTDHNNDATTDFADDAMAAANQVFAVTGGYYKGFSGYLICFGGPCAVKDGKLVAGEAGTEQATGTAYQGHWYFAPNDSRSTTASYIANPDSAEVAATPYVVETAYASYGYWLNVNDQGVVTVNPFADRGHAIAVAGDVATPGDETNNLAATASYAGSAVGISALRNQSGGRTTNTQSGHFTADVNLDATFGTDAVIEGSISNFQGGAVDTNWKVDLESKAFDGAGVAKGGGDDGGAWSSTTYGVASQRPVGITGTFNAHFTNGDAAGAYDARK